MDLPVTARLLLPLSDEVLALTDLDSTPPQAEATRLGMRDEGTTGRWFGLTTGRYRTADFPVTDSGRRRP